MSKKYRASITLTLEPDENGLLDWQDEDEEGRTEEELIQFAREELAEIIFNGVKYNDIWNSIDVEVIND